MLCNAVKLGLVNPEHSAQSDRLDLPRLRRAVGRPIVNPVLLREVPQAEKLLGSRLNSGFIFASHLFTPIR